MDHFAIYFQGARPLEAHTAQHHVRFTHGKGLVGPVKARESVGWRERTRVIVVMGYGTRVGEGGGGHLKQRSSKAQE